MLMIMELLKMDINALSAWTPFYDLLIAKLMEIKMEYSNKNIAISHSVYKRCVRDYIRKQ